MRSLYFIIFSLVFSSPVFSAEGVRGLLQQLDEDFAQISRGVRTSELLAYFQRQSNLGEPALYVSIRNNQFSFIESPSADTSRTHCLKNYFAYLKNVTRLPNVDFIIITPDGLSGSYEFPVFGFSILEGEHKNACHFPNTGILNIESFHTSHNYLAESERIYPWKMKKDLVFFRGTGTGGNLPDEEFCGNHRARIMVYSFYHPDIVDARITRNYYSGVAQIMQQHNVPWGEEVPFQEFFKYKYLIDVEGNAAGYERPIGLLFSNSVMLKITSGWSQWYDRCLMPYHNYIPVKTDLSDLESIVDKLRKNDTLAYQVARNGQLLAQSIFSQKMIDFYITEALRRLAVREILDR